MPFFAAGLYAALQAETWAHADVGLSNWLAFLVSLGAFSVVYGGLRLMARHVFPAYFGDGE